MDIREGFSGRVIFITGGTGFVGKVLLYKILKEFGDVRTIYLLMRGKKSRQYNRYLKMQERLELELLTSPCFEPIRNAVGDAKWKELCDKIKPMGGDITEDHLGLSDQDRTTIANEVNLIFHIAATVNFNERLDLSVQMNTLGPLRMLALAKTCKNLESMVHVSTCYVNYQRQGIDNMSAEEIYPLSFDAEEMVKAILDIHPAELKTQTSQYLKRLGFPNTYTFTKNMGEKLLARYRGDIPLAIVRPSIVGCSYSEPMPGWVDVLTAAGGLILTVGLGVVKELVCDEKKACDIVPVDFVVNILIKALFQTQQRRLARRALQQVDIEEGKPVGLGGNRPAAGGAPTAGGALLPVAAQWGKAAPKTGITEAIVTPMRPAAPAEALSSELERDRCSLLPEPLMIYHVATSGSQNRLNWGRVRDAVNNYILPEMRHPKSMGSCNVVLTTCKKYYMLRYHLMRYMPYMALKFLVKLPEPVGSPKKQVQVERLGRAVRRADMLNWEFYDFMVNEWMFSCENSMKLDDGLNERSKKFFIFDPYAINWYVYIQFYMYGILKYIVKDTAGFKSPAMIPSGSDLFLKASL
ncbi:unnamed protein product [Phytomonas sp. Hart1]|nr:unnamed protein product [Phytomonas sp. Hart1]|eukprot:CCW66005.1 unnamed protein product [Phytomonas sp. isolate Hart1]